MELPKDTVVIRKKVTATKIGWLDERLNLPAQVDVYPPAY